MARFDERLINDTHTSRKYVLLLQRIGGYVSTVSGGNFGMVILGFNGVLFNTFLLKKYPHPWDTPRHPLL